MKWYWILGIILIIFVGILILKYSLSNQETQVNNQTILYNVKPAIVDYCNSLEAKAKSINNGSGHCFTCSWMISNYNYEQREDISNISGTVYEINNNGTYRFLKMNLPLVYSWRNDRPGSVVAEFKIDKEGKIIEQDIPQVPRKCDEEL